MSKGISIYDRVSLVPLVTSVKKLKFRAHMIKGAGGTTAKSYELMLETKSTEDGVESPL